MITVYIVPNRWERHVCNWDLIQAKEEIIQNYDEHIGDATGDLAKHLDKEKEEYLKSLQIKIENEVYENQILRDREKDIRNLTNDVEKYRQEQYKLMEEASKPLHKKLEEVSNAVKVPK